MPTYDYLCSKCHATEEKFVPMDERDHLKHRQCGLCGYEQTRTVSAGCGVIFKGTGFYETDYKRKK